MRISDWSSDVCSSDLAKGIELCARLSLPPWWRPLLCPEWPWPKIGSFPVTGTTSARNSANFVRHADMAMAVMCAGKLAPFDRAGVNIAKTGVIIASKTVNLILERRGGGWGKRGSGLDEP